MRVLFWMAAAIVLSLSLADCVIAEDAATQLPVARRTIYPGDTITDDMITLKGAGQIRGVGALVTDAESLIGKTARRTLLPGQPIPKVAIREAYVVFQGKTVQVIFHSGTVTITGIALALELGRNGRDDQRSEFRLGHCHSRRRST